MVRVKTFELGLELGNLVLHTPTALSHPFHRHALAQQRVESVYFSITPNNLNNQIFSFENIQLIKIYLVLKVRVIRVQIFDFPLGLL
jgi:hypothetical protein